MRARSISQDVTRSDGGWKPEPATPGASASHIFEPARSPPTFTELFDVARGVEELSLAVAE